MEGDSDSLEECYNLLEKKRQNIGPAGVPQVRPMRDVEVRIHQEFSLNHPGVDVYKRQIVLLESDAT